VGDVALCGVASGEQSPDSSSNTAGKRSSSEMKLVGSSAIPLSDERRGHDGNAQDGDVGSDELDRLISIDIADVVEQDDPKEEDAGDIPKYMMFVSSSGKRQKSFVGMANIVVEEFFGTSRFPGEAMQGRTVYIS